MIGLQRIEVEGKRFVLVEEGDYERLCRAAAECREITEDDLPQFPKADKRGRFPALEYSRVALARDLICARKGAGLSQQQLAELAGVRQETISRLETAKYTPRPVTVDKIMQAIEATPRRRRRKVR